jgi:hypothetical protein
MPGYVIASKFYFIRAIWRCKLGWGVIGQRVDPEKVVWTKRVDF